MSATKLNLKFDIITCSLYMVYFFSHGLGFSVNAELRNSPFCSLSTDVLRERGPGRLKLC